MLRDPDEVLEPSSEMVSSVNVERANVSPQFIIVAAPSEQRNISLTVWSRIRSGQPKQLDMFMVALLMMLVALQSRLLTGSHGSEDEEVVVFEELDDEEEYDEEPESV